MKRILIVLAFLSFALVTKGEVVDCPTVTHEALKQALAEKSATIIDVNGTNSYKSCHIPGAIDFFAHARNLGKMLPADKNALIIVYCARPTCHAYTQALVAARRLGYKNVKHYAEGITGWKAAGEPTERS